MYLGVAENLAYPLMTLLMASSMSFSVICFLLARIAYMPASVHTERRSAPVQLGHRRARSSKRMLESQLMLDVWILKISVLPSRSGTPNSTLLSILPGRSRAGSSVSGRLVAMRTLTLPLASKPSSWLRSSMSVLWISLSAEVPSLKRLPPMASISSIKMTQGCFSLAYPNISRISRALSPMYLSTMALDTTLRKDASILQAIALASSVFPVPGGPKSRTPLGGLMPTLTNRSGLMRGSSMTSLICLI
mmetsp:Transcript_3129/g.7941  ORF Transcript_3129/g.7941 Transcript_3129/m.7941 type:complete len:248 (+) Transcript_3129:25-768(+)